MKAENKFKAPVATGNFVWTANPTSGRVAYVNAVDVQRPDDARGQRARRTWPLCRTPPTRPTTSRSCSTSSPRTRPCCGSTPRARLTTQTYASTGDANSWAISPSGHWGIAWTDATFVDNPDPTQGFQFVAVMDLSATVPDPLRPAPSTTPGRRVPAGGGRVLERRLARLRGDRGRDLGHRPEGRNADGDPPGPARRRRHRGPGRRGRRRRAPDGRDPGDAASAGTRGAGTRSRRRRQADRTAAGDDASGRPTPVAAGRSPDVSFTPDGKYALVRRDGLAERDHRLAGRRHADDDSSPERAHRPHGVARRRLRGRRAARHVEGRPPSDPRRRRRSRHHHDDPGAGPHDRPRPRDQPGQERRPLHDGGPGREPDGARPRDPADRAHPARCTRRCRRCFRAATASMPSCCTSSRPPAGSTAQGAFSVVPIGQQLPAVIESLPAPPTAVADVERSRRRRRSATTPPPPTASTWR